MRPTCKRVSPLRAAATFITVGSFIIILSYVVSGLWDIFWTDIVRSNPHRPVFHALTALPLMAAALGVVMVVLHFTGALLVAGLVAAFVAFKVGRIPFRALVFIALVCAVAIFLQDAMLPEFCWYTETPEDKAASANVVSTNVHLNAYFLPSLLGSWLALRWRTSGDDRTIR